MRTNVQSVSSEVSQVAPHVHEWRRLPDAVGLFGCRLASCIEMAVCPACLGSLDVAIQLREGIAGVTLYWCPVHRRREDM